MSMSERNEAPFASGAGAAPAAADGDLSREIERAVVKLPLDRVRCIRIFDDCYRCNWWAPFIPKGLGGSRDRSEINWGTGTTHYVRQSRFLVATLREGSLTIRERSD
jgi:hypothetical protein